MPAYKTHLVGGATTFLLTIFIGNQLGQFKQLSEQQTLLALLFCLLGSLFPDIDTKSKIQNILYIAIFITILFTFFLHSWFLFFVFSFIALAPFLTNHRGITHKAWFIILLPAILLIVLFGFNHKFPAIFFTYYLFFVLGAISHLILDFGVGRLFFHKKFN